MTARSSWKVRSASGDGGAAPAQGTREATVHEAKTHLSRLLDEVASGHSVVITKRGKPVARLQPLEERPVRVRGSMRGLIKFDDRFFDPLPDDELGLWGEIRGSCSTAIP